jgi:Erv1 / Alr family
MQQNNNANRLWPGSLFVIHQQAQLLDVNSSTCVLFVNVKLCFFEELLLNVVRSLYGSHFNLKCPIPLHSNKNGHTYSEWVRLQLSDLPEIHELRNWCAPDEETTACVDDSEKQIIKTLGPGMWHVIHVQAAACTCSGSHAWLHLHMFETFLKDMAHNFPCGECKTHFLNYLSSHSLQVDLGTYINKDFAILYWTFVFHNRVNQRLPNKAEISWRECLELYSL